MKMDGGLSPATKRLLVGILAIVTIGAVTSLAGATRNEENLTEALSGTKNRIVSGKKGLHLKRKFKSKVSLLKLKKADVEISLVDVERRPLRDENGPQIETGHADEPTDENHSHTATGHADEPTDETPDDESANSKPGRRL